MDAKEEASLGMACAAACEDYPKYFAVDVSAEVAQINTTVEEYLARLDEFQSLLETVRTDEQAAFMSHLPTLHDRCVRLGSVFSRIDGVEALVERVRRHVDACEERVAAAERSYKAATLKRMLGSIPLAGSVVRQLSTTAALALAPPAEPPGASGGPLPLFVSADYFRNPSAHYDLTADD